MLGALLLFAVLAVYIAWSALTARSALMHARSAASSIQIALLKQDHPAAQRALIALQGDFGRAHARTSGPVWAVGSHLPFVGADVGAVRAVSGVGDDLASGTVAELVNLSGRPLADRLAPEDGKIDLQAVQDLAPTIGRAHRNLDAANGRLRGIDSGSLGRWIRPSFQTFQAKVGTLDSAMGAADRAITVMPDMLGQGGPRTYLVLFDNNAEIRATGGLPGAFSIVRADHGRISLVHQGVPADIGKFARPVLPQSAAEKAIYFDQVAEYPQDTNFTPEFPRTAELLREMWRRKTGTKLDGVLSVDTVTLSYLLRATGPIASPDGVTLNAGNATRELLNTVYTRIPDGDAQNRYFRDVAHSVFDRLVSGVRSTPELVSALSRGVREGRLYVHDFDPSVQRSISGTTVAGELEGGDPRVPRVGVYLNDATGSKMSYYLRNRVHLTSVSCSHGVQELSGTADLAYTANSPPVSKLSVFITGPGKYGTPKGQQLVLLRIYGPKGGELTRLRVGGDPVPMDVVDDRGRPVMTPAVQLRRGDVVRVSWTVRSGPSQDRDALLSVSPGIEPAPADVRVPSQCGA